jgi:thiol-disulfide isomerase/thioredoxin
MRRTLFIAIAALVAVSTLPATDETEEAPTAIQSGLMELGFRVFKSPVEAPEFEIADIDGNSVTLSSYRGKVILLNFWATWCPPCRAEMPSMQRLYESLEGEAFEIVAVDLQESERAVRDFVKEYGLTFPVLIDSTGKVGATYGARSIPTTYLVDADGNAIGYLVGSREWDGEEVETLLRSILDD